MSDIPLRRKILVADACDKMWPPIGFSAPPATNVMVAPGSAMHGVGVVSWTSISQQTWVLTLHLVSNEDSNLQS